MHPQLSKARFEADLAGLDDELCTLRGWTVFAKAYPLLDIGFTSPQGRLLRLGLHCEDWNDQPPSIDLLDWDGQYLTGQQMPAPPPAPQTSIFNGSAHDTTRRPFICMRGSREYHTHSSHRGDAWAALKDLAEYRLGEIVTQVWNGWRAGNP